MAIEDKSHVLDVATMSDELERTEDCRVQSSEVYAASVDRRRRRAPAIYDDGLRAVGHV